MYKIKEETINRIQIVLKTIINSQIPMGDLMQVFNEISSLEKIEELKSE